MVFQIVLKFPDTVICYAKVVILYIKLWIWIKETYTDSLTSYWGVIIMSIDGIIILSLVLSRARAQSSILTIRHQPPIISEIAQLLCYCILNQIYINCSISYDFLYISEGNLSYYKKTLKIYWLAYKYKIRLNIISTHHFTILWEIQFTYHGTSKTFGWIICNKMSFIFFMISILIKRRKE